MFTATRSKFSNFLHWCLSNYDLLTTMFLRRYKWYIQATRTQFASLPYYKTTYNTQNCCVSILLRMCVLPFLPSWPLLHSLPGSLSSLPMLLIPSPSLRVSLSLGPFSFHPHAKSNHHLRGNGWSCDLHLFLWLVATRWSHLVTHTCTRTNTLLLAAFSFLFLLAFSRPHFSSVAPSLWLFLLSPSLHSSSSAYWSFLTSSFPFPVCFSSLNMLIFHHSDLRASADSSIAPLTLCTNWEIKR